MRNAFNFGWLVAAVIAGGCAYPEWSNQHSSRYYGMVDPDQTLERRLSFELNGHPDPDVANAASHVLVSAQNGTVTLNGAVPNEEARQKIDALVRSTEGVAVVNDQLLVPYTPTGDYGRPARVYTSPPE
jgi:osmotically-inducible protein OsmY